MMKRILLSLALLMSVFACGGGGDGATPPTPPVLPAVSLVSVTLGMTQLFPGATTAASAELRSASGAILTGRNISWSTSSSAVANVDQSGTITAVAPGSAVITATSEGQTGSATLVVAIAPVASVTVELSTTNTVVGTPVSANTTLRDARGVIITGRAVSWTSSVPTVATVDASGAITTLTPGTTTITATSEGLTGVATLTVVPPPVNTVTVTIAAPLVNVGSTTGAAAVLRDANGNVLSGRTVVWSSSSTSVASVDATGAITAIAPGTSTITATSEGKSGSAAITVQLVPVASVTINGPGTVTPGGTVQLNATLRDAAGNILTGRSTTWSSSAVDIALVSISGNVAGLAPGTTTITATSEGRSASMQLAVRFPIASVTVSGASRVKVGDNYTYTATARLTDGSIIVRPITWGTSQPSIATIAQNGVLTALRIGTFMISVTIDGEVWDASYSAYDWDSYTGTNGTLFNVLESDNVVTNKFGTAERPELIVSCSASGNFFVWIFTQHFVTQSGAVAMSFDGGTPFSQTWSELAPNYSTLWKPGSNATVKTFALQLAAARQFGFAFTEFQGAAKAMIYRVTGLSPLLPPLFTTCASNAIAAADQSDIDDKAAHLSSFDADTTFIAAAIRNARATRAKVSTITADAPALSGLFTRQHHTVNATRRKQ